MTTFDAFEGLPDEQLLEAYSANRAAVAECRERMDRAGWEIRKRIEDRGATAIPSDVYVCELAAKNTYDQSRFAPLKELLSSSDLEACLRSEHFETVTVPDKWDTVKVKAAARRYGSEALGVVEAATVPGLATLKFAKMEVKGPPDVDLDTGEIIPHWWLR